MKQIFFHSLIGFIALLFLTGCGSNSTSALQESESTSVKISITNTKESKLLSKQNLDINYMQVDVYLALSAIDESYLDKTPIQIGTFSKVSSEWKVSLSGLEKDAHYIFVVTAFSSETQDLSKLIFKGVKNQQIITGINEIKINLIQTSNANTVQNLPSASNIVVTKLADESIQLSFNVSNPYIERLKWEIQNDGISVVSTDFSINFGETNELTTVIKTNYLETNSNNYLLLLSTADAVISYSFSINMEGDIVDVSIETAPIIKKLLVSVRGTELLLKPELDKVASTYVWEIVENLGSAISIDDASLQNISLSEYTATSEFKTKLTVSSANGAFSYRIYHIFGNNSGTTEVVIPPLSVDTGNIKKTQQTVAYDALGDVSTNVKDDGNYKKGITPSYTKNPTTKIVTDNVTSLMWQDDNDTQLKWNFANQYCIDSTTGSFSDWRLPSRQELQTLATYFPLDTTSTTNEVLLDDIFVKMRTISHWSSSIQPDIVGDERTIIVNFRRFRYGESNGLTIYGGSYGVRCVRGILAQESFSKDIPTSIVTDPLNNLEWQDNGVYGEDETWSEAIDRCENLSLGTVPNDKGWRLPNINELMSIVDKPRSGSAPKMNSAFKAHPSFGDSYWSSTADFANKAFAYTVTYSIGASGTVGLNPKLDTSIARHTRCVRDKKLMTSDLEIIYQSLKLTTSLDKQVYSSSDTITRLYTFKNESKYILNIPENTTYSTPYYLIGSLQFWIERLGSDSTIPSISAQIARSGNKYAAGGFIVPVTNEVINPLEVATSASSDYSFNNYPVGDYRIYIDYKKVDGSIIETQSLDFTIE